MSERPKRVMIVEEGPREGFQSEPPGIATADKIALIEALADAGLKQIACCSFVNPDRLPQMADAEAIATGIRRRPETRYTGLWLNLRGLERALRTPIDFEGFLLASASDTFGLRNNGRDRDGLLAEQFRMADAYKSAGKSPGPAYVFTAFGCNYEGAVPTANVLKAAEPLLEICRGAGQTEPVLYLCDTVGYANPDSVSRTVAAVRERWPQAQVALHLHDTRGLGLANALAGLNLGVTRFDSSIGGLGGCPFAGNKAAAGNISTEDFAFMCEEMGIETGLDIDALIECAILAERIVGRLLPGRLMRAGRPRH